MERIRSHLSYANVAATLALVFGMTGGAVAATGGFSSGGKLQACANEEGTLKLLKVGKKCKRGQKTVAWNQTGPAGPKGANGAPGAPGAQGGQGGQGPQGTAVAYAHVLATGELDTAHSKNVSVASSIEPGFFCLTVTVPATIMTGVVDAGNSTAAGTVSGALAGQDTLKRLSRCPAGSSAFVAVLNGEAKGINVAFWVSFD